MDLGMGRETRGGILMDPLHRDSFQARSHAPVLLAPAALVLNFTTSLHNRGWQQLDPSSTSPYSPWKW